MLKSSRQYVQTLSSTVIRLWADMRSEVLEGRAWLRYLAGGASLLLLLTLVAGFFWSAEPELFSVRERVNIYLAPKDPKGKPRPFIAGAATTVTLIEVAETLLNKPGGYLSNDLLPPGVWMDNIPNWEYGALIQIRDLTRAMRESFSRSQSQSAEDLALEDAGGHFNFKHTSWVLPQTEDEYGSAIESLRGYLSRLVDESEYNAQFFTRADNLQVWLASVEVRLGSLSQNLSASVGQMRLDTDRAGDSEARQSTETPKERLVKTEWGKIDDVFYRARGSAWALVLFLKAVEIDFADVLEKKNALVSLQQIIRELESTQQALYTPMILNGGGFGVLANHSLVMASYISRANAGIIDLRELLAKG